MNRDPLLKQFSGDVDVDAMLPLAASSLAIDGEPALARGVEIGRYIILGLVGRGTMGEVYAAYDPELGRKVAIKRLRANSYAGTAGNQDRMRMMREAQSIARLSHPNVVVIHDVGTFRDTVFIAMEFVDGHTVQYWLHAETRPWSEVLKIFVAAGHGLAAAHDKEIVHGDFKPDNVMISVDGQVRVMDFGLARTTDLGGTTASDVSAPHVISPVADGGGWEDLLSTRVIGGSGTRVPEAVDVPLGAATIPSHDSGFMMGTPAYMAPEQFQGKVSDARGDQFSYCVALYEALYGECPFDGNTLLGRSDSVVAGNVRDAPVDSNVPTWIRGALMRGLQVNPAERWPSMKILLAELEEDGGRLAQIDQWLAARENAR